jgi:hypothetical protein
MNALPRNDMSADAFLAKDNVAQNYRQAFDLFFPPGAAIFTTTIWHRFPSPF